MPYGSNQQCQHIRISALVSAALRRSTEIMGFSVVPLIPSLATTYQASATPLECAYHKLCHRSGCSSKSSKKRNSTPARMLQTIILRVIQRPRTRMADGSSPIDSHGRPEHRHASRAYLIFKNIFSSRFTIGRWLHVSAPNNQANCCELTVDIHILLRNFRGRLPPLRGCNVVQHVD